MGYDNGLLSIDYYPLIILHYPLLDVLGRINNQWMNNG